MQIKVGSIRKPKPDEIIGVRVLNAGLHAYQTVINLEDVLSQITDYTTKQHIRSVISANKTFLNHTFFSAKLPKKEQEEMQETIEEASAGINAIMLIFRDLGTEAKTVLLNIANAMAYDGADAKLIEEVLSREKPAQKIEELLNLIPEDFCIYRENGVWQIAGVDDAEQKENESFSQFLCRYIEDMELRK